MGSTSDERRVARRLGVEARYGRHRGIGRFVNEGLAELHRHGVPLPPRIVVSARRFAEPQPGETETIAEFAPEQATIYLNPRARYWTDPAGYVRAQRMLGGWSSASPHHALLHEVAHCLYHASHPLLYDLLRREETKEAYRYEIQRVGPTVSLRAAAEPLEFIAEVFAGLVSGERYNEAVMELYRILGGPQA